MTSRIARGVSTLSLVLALVSAAQAGTFSTGIVSAPANILQAPFALAENTGSASSVTVGTGVFGPETYFTADSQFTGGSDTFANSGLNQLMSDGRYANSMSASLPVVSGQKYDLELLFWDPVSSYKAGSRLMAITAGSDTLTGFDVIGTTGGWKAGEGAKVDYTFTASGSSLSLSLLGVGGSQDGNAFVNGFSLTLLPEPSSLVLGLLGGVGLLVAVRRRGRARASATTN